MANASDTLFYYNVSRNESFEYFQHPDFVPTFGTDNADPALVNQANEFCTREGVLDTTCQYDYIQSGGNQQLAANTLDANNNYQSLAQDLST